jgi:D-alanyl-D-alanine carboxypeptidase
MTRFFTRRWDTRGSSEPRSGSAQARADGRRVLRRARPQAEVLDSRLLMAAGADSTASSSLSNSVAAVLQPYLSQNEVPGISVAVVTDGQVALAQGYGVSNVATRAPVEADTRFDIGSITKTFTSIGVLLLYQESQGTSHALNLNAPISDYLHNTSSFKLPSQWRNVTTMELLNMTSGIRDVGGPEPWQEELDSIANDRLLFTPGTKSSYSSANFDLLGDLIEQLSGEKYATFVQDQILDPLGMSESQVLGASAKVSNQAVGYNAPEHGRWTKAAIQNGKAMYAAAGIVSTAQDMGTYMAALLSGRLLDPATYALMWSSTPTPEYGVNPASDSAYGLGWDNVISTSDGVAQVTKSGQVPGFNSELILNPATDSGVFVSLNTNYFGSKNSNGITALQVAEAVDAVIQSGLTDE